MGRFGKVALIFSSLINSALFSGIVFGWAPLQLMLQDEGQYAFLCGPDDVLEASGMCPAQAARFSAIFACVAFLVNAISLVSGIFLDHFGGRAMATVAFVSNLSGLVLLAFADARSAGTRDWFLLGYSLLAVGGQMTLFTVFPTAFELPEYQTLVFATNSCLFDASSVVFQVMSTLHGGLGYSRSSLFLGYAMCACPLYLLNIVLWRAGGNFVVREDKVEEMQSLPPQTSSKQKHRIQHTPPSQRRRRLPITSPSRSPTPTSELPLAQQLQTWDFGFILFYASLGILRANLYIGGNEELLMNLGDNDPPNNRIFSKLFGYLLPLGFLFIPAIDAAVERSMPVALHITNFLAMAVAALMLIPSLRVQCAAFLAFAGFRAFLYGVMGAFIGQTFGPATLGRITGCVFTTGSIINLVQAPILDWINFTFAGDTSPLAALMLAVGVLVVPSIPK